MGQGAPAPEGVGVHASFSSPSPPDPLVDAVAVARLVTDEGNLRPKRGSDATSYNSSSPVCPSPVTSEAPAPEADVENQQQAALEPEQPQEPQPQLPQPQQPQGPQQPHHKTSVSIMLPDGQAQSRCPAVGSSNMGSASSSAGAASSSSRPGPRPNGHARGGQRERTRRPSLSVGELPSDLPSSFSKEDLKPKGWDRLVIHPDNRFKVCLVHLYPTQRPVTVARSGRAHTSLLDGTFPRSLALPRTSLYRQPALTRTMVCPQSVFEVFIIFCVLYTAIVEPLKVTYMLNVMTPRLSPLIPHTRTRYGRWTSLGSYVWGIRWRRAGGGGRVRILSHQTRPHPFPRPGLRQILPVLDDYLDIIFAFDIFFQCFCGYHDSGGQRFPILVFKLVIIKYMKTWFFIDLIAAVPFDRFFTSATNAAVSARPLHVLPSAYYATTTRHSHHVHTCAVHLRLSCVLSPPRSCIAVLFPPPLIRSQFPRASIAGLLCAIAHFCPPPALSRPTHSLCFHTSGRRLLLGEPQVVRSYACRA